MRNRSIFVTLLGLFIQFIGFGQLTPNGNSGASTTAYTNGAQNDPIYIWCASGLSTSSAGLTANPPSGSGPWTFDWFFHNENTSSWDPYHSEVGSSSTISNLASDGYRVEIYDAGSNLVGCYIAWVWNMNAEVTASNTPSACDATNLAGSVSANSSFTYYNPPPPESLITPQTEINVCFSATHTYVSDLAFYLVGPASCGSPTILLSPNPGAVGGNATCNGGNNVNNLCFTTESNAIFDLCSAATPLTGTYGGYSGGGGTLINWSDLYGCNAAQGGWSVQIYDCISQDVGSLTNATITFSNLLSICGSSSSITYSSGAINSPINDNSCSAATASIFQVPVSTEFLTPITINASTTYLWTSDPITTIPNAASSLTPSVTDLPVGTTKFYLTATVSFEGASCDYVDSTEFINTCCSAIADAGENIGFCSGGSGQIGTPSEPDMAYSWSPSTGLSDPNIAQPTVSLTNSTGVNDTIVYTLTVTNTVDGGCTNTSEVEVVVYPIPTVNAGTYPAVCIDANLIPLSGNPPGGAFSGNGVANNTFDPSVGTQTITYQYTSINGCSASATATITVNNLPNIDAGGNIVIPIGASVTLNATGGTTYIWNDGLENGDSFVPEMGDSFYVVLGTDANGCQQIDTLWVTVIPNPIINVPNVFTPNNDGSNDLFFIDAQYVEEIEYTIFNRWGNLVYRHSIGSPGWNGKMQTGGEAAEGVYFFTYRIVDLNGEVIEGHGNITLIR